MCRELYQRGHSIVHIVSRNGVAGRRLADSVKSTWSDDLSFPDSTQILLIAVPDHNLEEVLKKVRCRESVIIAHTAGSLGLDVFPEKLKNTGVFYPLQTFSDKRKLDLSGVPLFIEGSDQNCTEILKSLAETISSSVHLSDTAHRRLLHLAAVYVCNFTNYLLTIGKEISKVAEIPFETLHPLIIETVNKALELGPENSQTGPAVRNDLNIIEEHLDLLSFSPELKNIYDLITKSIISYYKAKGTDDQL